MAITVVEGVACKEHRLEELLETYGPKARITRKYDTLGRENYYLGGQHISKHIALGQLPEQERRML